MSAAGRRAALALGAGAALCAAASCAPESRQAAAGGGDSGTAASATPATPAAAVDTATPATTATAPPDSAATSPRPASDSATPLPRTTAAAPTPRAPVRTPRVRETPGGLAVTLERRPCHGTCPVYRVSVRELSDGRAAVRYDGERNVARVGAAADTVGRAALERIAAAIERADYFALPARYAYQEPSCPSFVTDSPVAVTTVRRGTRTHGVEHDYGCAGVPQALTAFEAVVDSAAGTARWVGRR